jgi:hypothetical protein
MGKFQSAPHRQSGVVASYGVSALPRCCFSFLFRRSWEFFQDGDCPSDLGALGGLPGTHPAPGCTRRYWRCQ